MYLITLPLHRTSVAQLQFSKSIIKIEIFMKAYLSIEPTILLIEQPNALHNDPYTICAAYLNDIFWSCSLFKERPKDNLTLFIRPCSRNRRTMCWGRQCNISPEGKARPRSKVLVHQYLEESIVREATSCLLPKVQQ